MSRLIKNGKICFKNQIKEADILIENGKIAAIGKINKNANEVIDAQGHYILPGLIDFHVHLDDQMGPYYLADTYKTGSQVAIQNGITTIVSFITQYPFYKTLTEAITTAYQKAEGNTYCNLTWHLTPRDWSEKGWQELDSFLSRGFKTLKLYTTYRPAGIYSDYDVIERVLKEAKKRNVRVLIHCEDEHDLVQKAKQSVNLSDAYSVTKLRPKQVEIDAIKKIIEISTKLQAPVHVVHVSTAEGAKLIAKARKNAPMTCETCPQYFSLNDSLLQEENGHRYLCTPPFRDEANRKQLSKMAQENYFDIFVTDHCAFSKKDKDENRNNLLKVPNGIPGLGVLLHQVNQLFESLPPDEHALKIAQYLSEQPAKLTGIYPRKGQIQEGADADLVIINFTNKSRSINATLSDVYDPYARFSTSLDLKTVLLFGEVVVRDNQLVNSDRMSGKLLCQI